MIATKAPKIGKAVGILMDLSADERTRLLEESRQKALWDYNSRMKRARDEGVQEGEQKKQRELLDLLNSGKSLDEIKRIFDNQTYG